MKLYDSLKKNRKRIIEELDKKKEEDLKLKNLRRFLIMQGEELIPSDLKRLDIIKEHLHKNISEFTQIHHIEIPVNNSEGAERIVHILMHPINNQTALNIYIDPGFTYTLKNYRYTMTPASHAHDILFISLEVSISDAAYMI